MSATPRVAKKFQIEPLDEYEVTETIAVMHKSEMTGHVSMETKQQKRKVKGGFMVYFPAGHSIRVETKEELQRLGLMESANSDIDLDTGLPVEPPKEVDLKELVQRRTQTRTIR